LIDSAKHSCDILINQLPNKYCPKEILASQKEGYSNLVNKHESHKKDLLVQNFQCYYDQLKSDDAFYEVPRFKKPTTFIDTNTLFTKMTYTGKDLYTKGLGGAENALINTVENLEDATVFNFTEEEVTHNNVTYKPYDAQLTYQAPIFIQRSIANLSTVPEGSTLLLHDQVFDDRDLLKTHLDTGKIARVGALSEYQEGLFLDHIGHEYKDKLFRFRNGSNFKFSEEPRNKNKFLYAHNPWRGLKNILDMWQNIQIGIPDAELHVFSGGFFDTDTATQEYYEDLQKEYHYLTNVFFNPLIPEKDLEKEYQTSHMYLYPGTTPETFGISVLHGIATGTPIVMNAVFGLIETADTHVSKRAYFTESQKEQFIAHIMRLYYDSEEWNRLHNNQKKIDCS